MTDPSFAKRLEILMGDANRSEFARTCELSEGAIRKYLNGTQPRTDILVQIADKTGASVEWLATGRGSAFPAQHLVEITPDLAQKLDMKEQYVRAIFHRIYTLQDETGAHINADNFYFALTMIHQVMLDRFKGEDATDEEIETVLAEYVDKHVKHAGWAKNE